MSSKWYVKKNGNIYGPHSSAKLREGVNKGMLLPDDLVRKGQDGQWKKASRIKGLFNPLSTEAVELTEFYETHEPTSNEILTAPPKNGGQGLLKQTLIWMAFITISVITFSVLYLINVFWPVVRLVTAAVAVLTLGSSCYFGARHYLAIKKCDTDSTLPKRTMPPLLASGAVTFGAILILALVPKASPQTKLRPQALNEIPQQNNLDKRFINDDNTAKHAATDEERATAEFLGALLNAAARQQQMQENDPRYQRFKQTLEETGKCRTCGGVGYYRYVDGSGVLHSRTCPSCNGTGRSY